MKRKIQFITALLLVSFNSWGQQWNTNGLNIGTSGNTFGTSDNQPINIYTLGIPRAQFTTGGALTSIAGNSGDGLRILNQGPFPSSGNLDMFTSYNNGGNETHIVWGGNGQISGQNVRFEQFAHAGGFWFDADQSGTFKFARNAQVTCFVGANNFWRIGMQSDGANINGARRLEVVDLSQQLRLTNGGMNSSGPYTDFFTNTSGYMLIQPTGGRVGINHLTVTPTATLDVNGDTRIRNVQAATPNSILIGVNANGPSDVNVRRLDFPNDPNVTLLGDGTWGTAGSNVIGINGLTYFSIFGVRVLFLGQNVGQVGNPGQLLNDREIPMNNHNLYFNTSGVNTTLVKNHVGIGYAGTSVLPAKLSVQQLHTATVNASTTGISGINNDVSTTGGTVYTGIEGKALGVQIQNAALNRGAFFTAQNSRNTIGVNAVIPASPNNIQSSYGGFFDVSAQAKANYGVYSRVTGVTNGLNCGVSSSATGSNGINKGAEFTSNSANTAAQSIGLSSFASGSTTRNIAGTFEITPSPTSLNIAVAAKVGNNSNPMLPATIPVAIYGRSIDIPVAAGGSYAGFFDGDVFINGPSNGTGFAITSDQQFKTNIDTLSTIMADSILKQLQPKTFFFDTTNSYGMNFSSNKQYGLIAQDVEPILPELVSNIHKPAMVDTSGNIAIQAVDYKSLNYNAFISILIKGHQEQEAKIDSLLANNAPTNNQNDSLQAEIDSLVAKNSQQDAVINDLNNRLTQLENCLGNLLPLLCQLNQSMIQTNNHDAQQQLRSLIRVDLNDNENIVLDQNVPNPFAESTIISYSIPTSVQKAQIHFYNLSGRLMKVVDITERGAGQLNVFGQDLSSGVYTYTLVADGRIIDTKKMVKEGY